MSVWQELAPSAPDPLGSVFFASSKAAGTITSYGIFFADRRRNGRLLQPLLGISKPKVTIKTMLLSCLASNRGLSRRRSTEKGQVLLGLGLSLLTAQGDRDRTPFPGGRPQSHGRHMVLELGWCGRSDTDRRYGVLPQEATLLHRVGHLMGEGQEEKEIVAWTERFRVAMDPYVKGSYINVPTAASTTSGPTMVTTLPGCRRSSAEYDPGNVFHFEQSIPRRESDH